MRAARLLSAPCALALLACMAPAAAQWQPFTWYAAPELGTARAAILLPVELDGIACTMQLDTGHPTSVLYRMNLPARLAPAAGATRVTVADVRIGAEHAVRTFDLMYDPRPGGQPAACDALAGTLGADLVAGARLTLDLPQARYRIDRDPAPASAVPGAHVLDMRLFAFAGSPKAQPMVEAGLDGGRRVNLLLDTGSALMALAVFQERDWLALTGLDGTAGADTFSVPRWGAMIPCYRAPTRAPVTLGSLVLPAGIDATYCADPRGMPPTGEPLYGLLGLATFLEKCITLDYGAGKFVVAPSTAAARP